MKSFSIIVAMDEARGIGHEGALPWSLPSDLKYFKQLTSRASEGKQNALIMGRKTWESIPALFRPLPGRLNVVLTRQRHFNLLEGVQKSPSLLEAFDRLDIPEIDRIFVIGGQQIFEQALLMPQCQKLYITHLQQRFDVDTFFPKFLNHFKEIERSKGQKEGDISFYFSVYQRRL